VFDDDPSELFGAIDDERLRLIFSCCHPALAMETRVALTLRMVGGLTVAEIARTFLVQKTSMGRRITRAKAKIKAARIPFRVPSTEDLLGPMRNRLPPSSRRSLNRLLLAVLSPQLTDYEGISCATSAAARAEHASRIY
jgi:hypothetical protein